jgi:hypothetical protein
MVAAASFMIQVLYALALSPMIIDSPTDGFCEPVPGSVVHKG